MKAVLMSIQPKWCELIASGKKTIEVRKTKPKLETPFKVYIYCTNTRPYLVWGDVFRGSWETEFTHLSGYNRKDAEKIWDVFNGKVIGEFVCNYIEDFKEFEYGIDALHRHIKLNACLGYKEIYDYLGFKKCGYGWHISDLVIYDKPKELSEFYTVDNEAVKQCEHRERVYTNPIFTNNALLLGSYICNISESVWCAKCKTKPITRPPQSWCYVERLGEG